MRRRLHSIAVCLVLVMGMVMIMDTNFDDNIKVKGAIIYVNDSGTPVVDRIQDAIDIAGDGDTIWVEDGTYYETGITVNKRLNIIGHDSIIHGGYGHSGYGWSIRITADYVNFTGFTITDEDYGIGIYKGVRIDSDYNSFTYNEVYPCEEYSIYVASSSSNNIISNNMISESPHGIYLDSSDENTISDNYITSVWNYGVHLVSSDNNEIHNNTIHFNGGGVFAEYSFGNKIADNMISESAYCGIQVAHSDDSIIIDNSIVNSWDGIDLGLSTGIIVAGNTIYNDNEDPFVYCEYGISLWGSSQNVIKYNTVSDCGYGFYIDSSFENNITNNIASYVWYHGIDLSSSFQNNITDNTVSYAMNGIALSSSYMNLISGNQVSYCTENGIYVYDFSDNNKLTDNVLSKAMPYGIHIRYSLGTELRSNWMNRCGIFITGNRLDYWNTHMIDITNTVDGKPVYYLKNQTGGMIPPGAGQVILANCTYIEIENQEPNNGTAGIILGFSQKNNIANNSIFTNNEYGIYLYQSHYNNVTQNEASNSNNITWGGFERCGIYLDTSNGNNINDNTASYNFFGIYTKSSFGNYIIGNSAVRNELGNIVLDSSSTSLVKDNNANLYGWAKGISLWNSNFNNIIQNYLSSNNRPGISLLNSSFNNISRNNAYRNNIGIILRSHSNENNITMNTISDNSLGISIDSSSNNLIYHNKIINNTNQAKDVSNNNYWDNGYPSGGNYWSDYTGVDKYHGPNQDIPGSDGIGDTPYWKDDYPLMGITFLSYGWNLVSMSLIQTKTSLGSVLKSIQGQFVVAQWYNAKDMNNHWKHYHELKPSYMNGFNQINHTMGFKVHITDPEGAALIHKGTRPTENQNISLNSGWNMVGYPSLSAHNQTAALNNLVFGTHVDSVWAFVAATQSWEEIGPADNFELGKGYWIHAMQDCVWEVPL